MELTMTVIFLLMAGVSMMFWIMEGHPIAQCVKKMSPIQWCTTPIIKFIIWPFQSLEMIPRAFKIIAVSKFLFIDVGCTILLTVLFGLGGNTGAAMGMTMSNVLSVYLVVMMKKGQAECSRS